MRRHIQIENIEEMRRQQGIDDIQLRKEIQGLAIGGLVRLTLLNDTKATVAETLVVRITSIKGRAFRGKLTDGAVHSSLAQLRAGSAVIFAAEHIHSLAKPPLPAGVPDDLIN